MNDHEKHWGMKHQQNDLMHVLHRSVELTANSGHKRFRDLLGKIKKEVAQ